MEMIEIIKEYKKFKSKKIKYNVIDQNGIEWVVTNLTNKIIELENKLMYTCERIKDVKFLELHKIEIKEE